MSRSLSIPYPLLAAGALGAVVAAANANVTISYSSSTQFSYRVDNMPDFDQKRNALPNDGKMYCIPTSGSNVLTYAARHGYPGLPVPDETVWHWQSHAHYGDSTSIIAGVAAAMGTHPQDGTKGSTGHAALKALMGQEGLLVGRQALSGGDTPRFGDLADVALGEALVIPIVGWYVRFESADVRTGGHAVVASKIQRSGSFRQIAVRDPGRDSAFPEDLDHQGAFSTEKYTVDARLTRPGGDSPRMMDVFSGLGFVDENGNEKIAILDGFYFIAPLQGWTTAPNGLVFHVKPKAFSWDSAEILTQVPTGLDAFVFDIAIHPMKLDPFLMTDATDEQPSSIWKLNRNLQAAELLLELTQGVDMTFSRHRRLYVLDGVFLRCFNIDGDEPVEETNVRRFGTRVEYDDVHDRVIVYNAPTRSLISYSPDLDDARTYPLDPDIALGPDPSMSVSPADGRVWITSPDSTCLYGVALHDDGTTDTEWACPAGLESPSGLQSTDDDHLLVISGGTMTEYLRNRHGTWVRDPSSLFDGIDGLGDRVPLALARSRTNFDASMDDPIWNNELPPEGPAGTPDCRADVNLDGQVDFADILAVLSAWGTDDADADLAPPTGDGIVGFDDLLGVLAAWGPCPEE